MSENGKKKKSLSVFLKARLKSSNVLSCPQPKDFGLDLTLGAKVSLLVSDLQTGSLHKMTREQWCVWSSSFSLWVNLQSSSLPLLVILEVRERFNVRVSVTLNSAYHAAVNGWTWPDGGCVVFFCFFFVFSSNAEWIYLTSHRDTPASSDFPKKKCWNSREV